MSCAPVANLNKEDPTLSPSAPVGETVSSVTVPDPSNFTPATMQEVEKVIKRSPAKSCGLDPVPTLLLKQHVECLVPFITSIVNMSLADGVFPDQFKTAHVCPLPLISGVASQSGAHRQYFMWAPVWPVTE